MTFSIDEQDEMTDRNNRHDKLGGRYISESVCLCGDIWEYFRVRGKA